MHNDMIEPHHFPINMFEVHGFLWGRESDYNTSLYQHKPLISKQKPLAPVIPECSRQTVRLELTAQNPISDLQMFFPSLCL